MSKFQTRPRYRSSLCHYLPPSQSQSALSNESSNNNTIQSHTLKLIPLKKTSFNSFENDDLQHEQSFSPMLLNREDRSDIDKLVCNVHLLNTQLNHKFDQLDELNETINEFPKIPKMNKLKSSSKCEINKHTLLQKSQNDFIMKKAQKQLNKRLKTRILIQYQKLAQLTHLPNYSQHYNQIKSIQPNKISNQQFTITQSSIQLPFQGIKFYSQLQNKPAILNYIKQKTKSKSTNHQSNIKQNQKLGSKFSMQSLEKKKKKKEGYTKSKIDSYSDLNQQQQQLININHISDRLRKIYSRKIPLNLNQISQQQLKNSKILQHQYQILEQLDNRTLKLSIRHKQQLLNKFNNIIKMSSKSLSPKNKCTIHNNDKKSKNMYMRMKQNKFNDNNIYDNAELRKVEKTIQKKMKNMKKYID